MAGGQRHAAVSAPRGRSLDRVLIACAVSLVAEGVARVIDHLPGVAVAGICDSVTDLFAEARRSDPAVIVVDDMLDSAFHAVRLVAGTGRSVVVVLPPTRLGRLRARTAMRAGASAVVSWASGRAVVADALRHVSAGDRFVAPELRAQAAADDTPAMSPRESEVLQLVCRGLDNREIARRLFVSSETVKTHVRNIARKLGARDRIQVVVNALQSDLVHEGIPSPRT